MVALLDRRRYISNLVRDVTETLVPRLYECPSIRAFRNAESTIVRFVLRFTGH